MIYVAFIVIINPQQTTWSFKMSTLVPDNIESSLHTKMERNGVLIHTIEVTNESKGAWSELYLYEGEIFNAIYTDTQNAYLACIEKLDSPDELSKYVGQEQADELIQKHTL